jgi:hypothetical protein
LDPYLFLLGSTGVNLKLFSTVAYALYHVEHMSLNIVRKHRFGTSLVQERSTMF